MRYQEHRHTQNRPQAQVDIPVRVASWRGRLSIAAACLVTMFALAAGSSAFAQERPAGLDLSDEQRDQIRALMQQERTDARASRAEIRGQIAALLTDEQRDQILDDAIMARFEGSRGVKARTGRANFRGRDSRVANRINRGEERIRRNGDRAVVHSGRALARRTPRATVTRTPAQRMIRSLDVTDDQRDQVAAILKSQRDAVTEWRQQNADADRSERIAFMNETRSMTRTAIRDILTEEQRARFDDHSERRDRRERRPSPRRER